MPDIRLTLTDSDLLDWLEENHAKLEFHYFMPNGKPGERFWITTPLTIPGIKANGVRLRDAIGNAVAAHERMLKRKEKRGQPEG